MVNMNAFISFLLKIKRSIPVRILLSYIYIPIYANRRKKLINHLKKHLHGKEVLILGSGPSAENLNRIPKDTLVMTVNLSIFNLPVASEIFLHSTTSHALKEAGIDIYNITEVYNVSNLLVDERKIAVLSNSFLINFEDVSFVKEIFPLTLFKKLNLLLSNQHFHPSQGVNLILLTHIAGAKKIYVSGIDIPKQVTYASKSKYPNSYKKKNMHYKIDSELADHLLKSANIVFLK